MIEVKLTKLINSTPVGYLTDGLWITAGGKVLPIELNEFAEYELTDNPQPKALQFEYEDYERLTRDYFRGLIPRVNPRMDMAVITKHLPGQHDQASHGRRGVIKPGIENWNPHVGNLLEAAKEIDPRRGSGEAVVFTEAAGFNGKPRVLSQEEFDALEGETIYRGVGADSELQDYRDSLVQYGSRGTYGNGAYFSNDVRTAQYYAADSGYKSVMQAKLLPTANVVSFENLEDFKTWRTGLEEEWFASFSQGDRTPVELNVARWHLTGSFTPIAMMKGVDAFRFPKKQVFETDRIEFYTVVLNRGQVAINDDYSVE
jgi:hypothetical protein